MSSVRQAAETAAQITTPVPIGISGLTWMGITMKDWVLMGTGILLVFQLIVVAPKAYRVLRQCKRNTEKTIKGVIDGEGHK